MLPDYSSARCQLFTCRNTLNAERRRFQPRGCQYSSIMAPKEPDRFVRHLGPVDALGAFPPTSILGVYRLGMAAYTERMCRLWSRSGSVGRSVPLGLCQKIV